jgi:hypothetical protein
MDPTIVSWWWNIYCSVIVSKTPLILNPLLDLCATKPNYICFPNYWQKIMYCYNCSFHNHDFSIVALAQAMFREKEINWFQIFFYTVSILQSMLSQFGRLAMSSHILWDHLLSPAFQFWFSGTFFLPCTWWTSSFRTLYSKESLTCLE